jgi:hypothetical protein
MKKILITVITIVSLICINLAVPALAAKPIDVIQHSNGFPSGMHFNLNLHGRDCATWTGDYTGNAIVIPLYSSICGDATIEYLSNKKNTNKTELYVVDPLTEPFDGDSAQVYLPYNIDDDGDPATPPVSARGYYVFGRILGKPGNGSSDNQSSLLLYPNSLVAASNSDNNSWPWNSDNITIDDHIYLDMGVITSNGQVGVTDPSGFFRFDPPTDDPNEKGKGNKTGKSKGVEITQLFLWSGYIADLATYPDNNGNGAIDVGDVPQEWIDAKGYSVPLTEAQFEEWLSEVGATEYENAWIFDIAEMVISGQQVVNDGTKNFQIRFYPVETTEFTSDYIGP